MSGVQLRVDDDDYHPHPNDLDEDEWREYYERCDGVLRDVARALGKHVSPKTARRRLTKLGIHDPADNKTRIWELHNVYPHQVEGLSPLNCGDCGVEEIFEHPCPECGYDPGGVGDD